MIVTYRKAQAPIFGSRIVVDTPYAMRDRPVLPPDPEADERIKLFFAKMIRPR